MPRKTDDLKQLADEVIATSLNWTGADEEAIPGLKKIRTLAGLALKQIEEDNAKNFLSVFSPKVRNSLARFGNNDYWGDPFFKQ